MASNPTSPLSSTVRAWRTRSLLSIERQLLAHNNGLVAGQKLAQATDSMLRGVGKRLALPTRDLAIVAVGGYGDGVLAPHSDLDLMLITRSNPEAAFADATPSAQLLYALWDAGLKLGYSIHSPASLLEACSNLDTRTSMLSARHIWGDRTLLESIDTSPPNLPRFVRDKFDERDARHLRYGDSRYVLQPDVKEGKGALRDLHTVSWLMRACEGHNDLDRLQADGVITNAEVALFRRAQRFLMAVRAHCHLISRRQENVLRFDLQPEIASRMNYRRKQGKNTEAARLHATERFMRNYYWSVKEVGNLTRTVCTLLEARHKKSTVAISLQSHVVVEGFPIANGRIDFPDSEITPQRIMQLFRVAHRRQCKFTPECLRTVRRYAPRFVAARHEPSIVQDLMAMLCPVPRIQIWHKRGLRSPHRQRIVDSPEHYLRVMSESGVLGRMLPDFGRIIASMQYDNYHVYTNDEHTIRAIGILARIDAGELVGDHPLASELVQRITHRRALYVAVLLHDIAKGRGGDHSRLGEEVAQVVCPQLGMQSNETQLVAWLVRHHLLFSHTAFTRDLGNPETIADFADIVQSAERLRLLLCLTVVDIRAVGPNIWTSWKRQLLTQLFLATEIFFDEGQAVPITEPHAGAEDITAFIDSGLPCAVVITAGEEFATARVLGYDSLQFLPMVAGSITLAGGYIVNARTHLHHEGRVQEFVARITHAHTKGVDLASNLGKAGAADFSHLKALIADTFDGLIDVHAHLRSADSVQCYRSSTVLLVPPRVSFDVARNRGETIIEVEARSRPGLLYDLVTCIDGLGLQIRRGFFHTQGEQVQDVFYVRDRGGLAVSQPKHLDHIRESILAAVVKSVAF